MDMTERSVYWAWFARTTSRAREYAQDLELGSPIAVGDESVWLHYAADEPPLVVLIAAGGKVLRGWPGGIDADDLAGQLEKLYEKPAVEDQ